ncbi:UNVERIFIED_CONTAM: hypothetical protein HDU68_012298 [Siphonaria sp. JEL0065]|nr:hypothetical protein HDU68_012298 [Siphonaria sp. JEL0065]
MDDELRFKYFNIPVNKRTESEYNQWEIENQSLYERTVNRNGETTDYQPPCLTGGIAMQGLQSVMGDRRPPPDLLDTEMALRMGPMTDQLNGNLIGAKEFYQGGSAIDVASS